jgi:hypothetical protein
VSDELSINSPSAQYIPAMQGRGPASGFPLLFSHFYFRRRCRLALDSGELVCSQVMTVVPTSAAATVKSIALVSGSAKAYHCSTLDGSTHSQGPTPHRNSLLYQGSNTCSTHHQQSKIPYRNAVRGRVDHEASLRLVAMIYDLVGAGEGVHGILAGGDLDILHFPCVLLSCFPFDHPTGSLLRS